MTFQIWRNLNFLSNWITACGSLWRSRHCGITGAVCVCALSQSRTGGRVHGNDRWPRNDSMVMFESSIISNKAFTDKQTLNPQCVSQIIKDLTYWFEQANTLHFLQKIHKDQTHTPLKPDTTSPHATGKHQNRKCCQHPFPHEREIIASVSFACHMSTKFFLLTHMFVLLFAVTDIIADSSCSHCV